MDEKIKNWYSNIPSNIHYLLRHAHNMLIQEKKRHAHNINYLLMPSKKNILTIYLWEMVIHTKKKIYTEVDESTATIWSGLILFKKSEKLNAIICGKFVQRWLVPSKSEIE